MGQVNIAKESERARNSRPVERRGTDKSGQQKKARESVRLTSCRAWRFDAGGCGTGRHRANCHGARRRRYGPDAGSGTATSAEFDVATGAESEVTTDVEFDVATGTDFDVATGAGTSVSSANSRNMRRKLSESEIGASCWKIWEMW